MKYNDPDYRNEANWPHPDPERETWVDSLAWAVWWFVVCPIIAGAAYFIILRAIA